MDSRASFEEKNLKDSDLESAAVFENSIRFEGLEEEKRGRRRGRPDRKQMDRSKSRSLSIRRRISADVALPPAFKTISHRIDDYEDHEKARQSSEKKTSLDEFVGTTWHTDTAEDVIKSLESDATIGLTKSQVEAKTKIYGLNVQSKPPSRLLHKIFMYFFGGFGPLLMIGGILCCIAWKPLGNPPATANIVLGVILFIVFATQAAFNFWQDYSSSRVMDSIHNMIPDDSATIRDGDVVIVPSKNLLPGDIINFSAGTKIPADMRIISNSPDLAFDRSVLTGESKAIPASSKPEAPFSNYLESSCIAMQGTFCSTGSGTGIVVSTGDNTIFGKVAKMTAEPKRGLTPLQKEILRFVILTSIVIISLIILIIILWAAWLHNDYPDWINGPTLIVDIVSIGVAFMPEGLPIALTSCLIITAGVMKKKKVLCKSLSVVETLGSVSVLCLDKTGTLTRNMMTVSDVTIGSDEIEDESRENEMLNSAFFLKISIISGLCNAAYFEPLTLGLALHEQKIIGNATDSAVLKFAAEKILLEKIQQSWKEMSHLSFSSKKKFMAKMHSPLDKETENTFKTLFSNTNSNDRNIPFLLLTVKGAPDVLYSKCTHILNENGVVSDLDDKEMAKIKAIQLKWASLGKRVILLAMKVIPNEQRIMEALKDNAAANELMEELSGRELTLVGLMGISDPLKDDIPYVIRVLKDAGIRPVMVTGDYEYTGLAIARKAGMITKAEIRSYKDLDPNFIIVDEKVKLCDRPEIDEAIVMTGTNISELNENQWEHLSQFKEIVFARTTPEQKLRIVEEFQKRKNVVGMTGDGVNDAPSLKQADVGIAMVEGSDIAKEAADLVLLESFSLIIVALKYGRLVFENLKKTITYLLPAGTYAELWPVLLNVIFGLPQALSSFYMIIICCLTDCAGAITLAYEAPERNLLKKKPRSISGERLVNLQLFLHSYFTIGTYYTFTSMLMAFICFQRMGIPFKELTLAYGNYSIDSNNVTSVGNVASSVYFINLVIMQLFNLLAVRTRHLSIFQHPPIRNPQTRNYILFVAAAFAIGVTFLFNYIPWFRKNIGTARPHVEYYFIAVGFGLMVLTYDETRKFLVRKYPKSVLAKIAW